MAHPDDARGRRHVTNSPTVIEGWRAFGVDLDGQLVGRHLHGAEVRAACGVCPTVPGIACGAHAFTGALALETAYGYAVRMGMPVLARVRVSGPIRPDAMQIERSLGSIRGRRLRILEIHAEQPWLHLLKAPARDHLLHRPDLRGTFGALLTPDDGYNELCARPGGCAA